MTKTIIKSFLAVWLLGIVTIALLGGVTRCCKQAPSDSLRADTIRLCDTIVDTIIVERPVPAATKITGHVATTAPIVTDSTGQSEDSATVELPVISRHYVIDSVGEAWVSGPVDPRLDSIRLFRPRYYQNTTITHQTKPPSHWSVGVQAGYGMTPKGLQPYIGFGVSYRLTK